MTKLLFTLPFNTYYEVSPLLLNTLMECKAYKQEYDEGYKYREIDNELELRCVTIKDFITTEPTIINIEAIMGENDRLTRENEQLLAKLNNTNTEQEHRQELAL